jgi:hypothetical protein
MILIPVNPSLSRRNSGHFADPVIPQFPEIPAQSGSGKIRVRVSSRSWPFEWGSGKSRLFSRPNPGGIINGISCFGGEAPLCAYAYFKPFWAELA